MPHQQKSRSEERLGEKLVGSAVIDVRDCRDTPHNVHHDTRRDSRHGMHSRPNGPEDRNDHESTPNGYGTNPSFHPSKRIRGWDRQARPQQ
jgi:hypothetical protein